RGYYRRKRNHGVVTEVKQETGDNRTGKSSRKSENDSDGNQHRHKSPRPAELSAVHQAEQRPRQDNAETGAGTNSLCGFSTKKTRNPEISSREQRIQIPTKHGFLDKWSDKHGHAHQEQRACSVLEQVLNGKVLRSLQARAGDRHAHGKTNTTAKIDPWIGGCVGRPYKFSPSEGL